MLKMWNPLGPSSGFNAKTLATQTSRAWLPEGAKMLFPDLAVIYRRGFDRIRRHFPLILCASLHITTARVRKPMRQVLYKVAGSFDGGESLALPMEEAQPHFQARFETTTCL